MPIDFRAIRTSPHSANDSFESLATVLFQEFCKIPTKASFFALRGAGGDGGVEAFFDAGEAGIYGLQAKYFFGLGASEFSQLKKSFSTALTNYPNLRQYWIYLPFDLTGRRARGNAGRSEVERFEEWKRDEENAAAAASSPVEIVVISASAIEKQLLQIDAHGGYQRYWFGQPVLTEPQIRNGLDAAQAFAGPRYTSYLDVTTTAHDALDSFGKAMDMATWLVAHVRPLLRGFTDSIRDRDELLTVLPDEQSAQARSLLKQFSEPIHWSLDADPIPALNQRAVLLPALRPLIESAEKAHFKVFCDQHGADADTPGFRQWHAEWMADFPAGNLDSAREALAALDKLGDALAHPILKAYNANSFLLVGAAGIGKTHALLSAALRRLRHGAFSLVLFGENFDSTEPWEAIRTALGMGSDVSQGQLFECLAACASATGYPFVIFIDALNDTSTPRRWLSKLPQLIELLRPYEDVKIAVSVRDTYLELVVGANFPGCVLTHTGFEGRQLQAIEAFSTTFGLDSGIVPVLGAELSNPLFLRMVCQTLQANGQTAMDVSLPGFMRLFNDYLSFCNRAIRNRMDFATPENVVRKAMVALVDFSTAQDTWTLSWSSATQCVRRGIDQEISAARLLREMHQEGLLIIGSSADDDEQQTVRFGYQRFSDALGAQRMVTSTLIAERTIDTARLASAIATVTEENRGLLEMLAAFLPEDSSTEITDDALGIDEKLAMQLLISSLPWRSRESITTKTEDYFDDALNRHGLWREWLTAMFSLCLVPGHALNADRLHGYLYWMRTDKRDPLLSDMALHSFEGDGIVAALLSGALRADVTRWSSESRRLAALTLCWLCACADRRIRDRAAKALTRLMSIDPALAPPVCEQITSCDDDYVLESVVQAVYSACLLNPDAPRKFASALHFLFDTRRFSGNAFIREHVLLLGLTINAENLSDEARQRLEIIPNRVAWPDPWPTAADIRAIADLDKLPLNMQLVGDKIQPDFLRYIVAPAVSDFDLKSVNVTQENIATWIMREALAELKYPGAGGNCRIYDSRLSAKYGQGRAKPGYAEGIGKKYYWIALHRLVALLRDNVRPSEYARDSPGLGLRSVDLTDIRDISAPVPYPDEVSHVGRYPYASQAPADKDWFLETIDITAPSSTIVRLARNGTEWVSLDLYATDDDTDEDEPSWTTPHRFVRYSLSSRLAPKDTVIPEQQMRRSFEESGNSTRQLFVGEYPGSPAFELEMAGRDATSSTDELVFSSMTLTRGGAWQYEFASDSRLESFEVPCPDMVDALELKWDRQVGWRDNQGNIVAFYSKVRSNQGLFIQRDALDRYLEMSQRKLLFCIYLNKGKSSPSSGGKQVDRHTFLAYRPGHELTILVEELEPIGWSIRE